MTDDLIAWFQEAGGFQQGTKAPHKWVLQAEQELRLNAAELTRLRAKGEDLAEVLAEVLSDLEIGAHPYLHIERIRAALSAYQESKK